LDARLTTSLCKEKSCCESQRSENRTSLAESSKEGYGSERTLMMMMMMMMMKYTAWWVEWQNEW
jgi:hypothetical protein